MSSSIKLDMIPLHLDTLDINRQSVFKNLKSFRTDGVLAGGTAIALQIGHRRSFDFDIFTQSELTPSLWSKVRRIFDGRVTKTLSTKRQLNFVTSENIVITFYHDEVTPLYPEIQTQSIGLADLRDLAGNKAFTIGGRGKWRDYIDLYFLLKTNTSTLEDIIDNCSKRSKGEIFPVKLFLEQLVYFDDLAIQDIDYIGPNIDPSEVKQFLSQQVRLYNIRSLT